MKRISFKWADDVPLDQIDRDFIQGMFNRMIFGFHKYGHMRRAHDRPDNLKNIDTRKKMYKKTGNTEWLMDVANFAMMEFAKPAHHKAHFRATSASESPGSHVAGRVIRDKSELKPTTGIHAPRRQREGD
jgi:hypothetical protein